MYIYYMLYIYITIKEKETDFEREKWGKWWRMDSREEREEKNDVIIF